MSIAGFQPADRERFEATIRRFDAENAKDPNREPRPGGGDEARELAHARYLADWVLRLAPNASEPLRLAARSQHICRWLVSREKFPLTRAGYHQWRSELKKIHARLAGEIMRETGYPADTIERVQMLNLKKTAPGDPEAQVLEDALCLVFLEHQFAELAAKISEEKMTNALRKTWKKMSPAGRAEALKLRYAGRERALIQKAALE
ncbi:MAG TPA: DUF4202 domain-containing protein [Verrucomicrobiae bacterium]|nr:DUF4202 domain-containing protein [Verrucomicrobiae bacterium]